jgi:hypothetical protein
MLPNVCHYITKMVVVRKGDAVVLVLVEGEE